MRSELGKKNKKTFCCAPPGQRDARKKKGADLRTGGDARSDYRCCQQASLCVNNKILRSATVGWHVAFFAAEPPGGEGA